MKALYRFALVACAVVASAAPSLMAQQPPQLFVEVGHANLTALHAVRDSSGVLSRTAVGMRLDVLFGHAGGPAQRVGLRLGDRDGVAALRRVDAPDVNGFRSWVGVLEGVDY